MKKLFIVANWKSHKTSKEVEDWFEKFHSGLKSIELFDKIIILCPPLTLLSQTKKLIEDYKIPIALGSQNLSEFDEGAYTGEVSAKQIKEFANYAIIGHSERRTYFHEDYDMLSKKVSQAKDNAIIPIFCIQGKDTTLPSGVELVAFEPIEAIGTGNPDTPEDADQVASEVKVSHNTQFILYGGSVTPDNVRSFTEKPSINGVLVGTASLDPHAFLGIVSNA